MNNINTLNYSTNDTALAAYLVSQGYELLELDFNNNSHVTFIFSPEPATISDCVRSFEAGLAEGNIMAFFRNYKRLLSRIRSRI